MKTREIVATIGPSSGSEQILTGMINAGMSVARLNFSWGTYDKHREYTQNIRNVAKKLKKKIPIIQDLSGPREQGVNSHYYNKNNDGVLTEKDKKDLDFGATQNFEYVALSYVSNAKDISILKTELKKRNYKAKIIAKIERKVAIDNLNQIMKVADVIMIARGDLGNEIPIEKIPHIEKIIIEKCNKNNIPVITATQMMLSMTENKVPTRAEVTDVAFAIMSGSDAVMLSEESANGKYPLESVAIMEKVVKEAQKYSKRKVALKI